jgi:tetratricopeptide (TPR) repeat protein
LKKILSQDGRHIAARRYLADIYTEKGLFNEAIHQLNRLAMQYPDDARILFNLAVACYNAKDIPRAMSNLKAAQKLTRDDDLLEEIRAFLAHLDQFDG